MSRLSKIIVSSSQNTPGTWGYLKIQAQVNHIFLATDSEPVPYVAKFRPISPVKVKAAREMIDCLLHNNIISRKIAPWVANLVWVVKARPILTKEQAANRGEVWEGQTDTSAPISLRLTVSYVKLNTYLEAVPTPLPNIKKLF